MLTLISVVAQVSMISRRCLCLATVCSLQHFLVFMTFVVLSVALAYNNDHGKVVWMRPGRLERCIIDDDVQSEWIVILATGEETQNTKSPCHVYIIASISLCAIEMKVFSGT